MAAATRETTSIVEKEEFETSVEHAEHFDISVEHQKYLFERHGTAKLEPCPAMDDNDPLNWPNSKKFTNLALVAFHSAMATISAASIQSAFFDIAKDLDVPVQTASYLVSVVILVLGVAPLFWRPISEIYGRRPVFLTSLICSAAANAGCAVSPSFGSMIVCRVIAAFFISPPAAVGGAVVSEMFFKKQRARYLGIWTSMVQMGVPLAGLVFGFVAVRVGYRWIYWTLAITNGIQFILYLFLGPESRYVPGQPAGKNGLFSFSRISPEPITMWSFVSPLALAARLCVLVPAVSAAMVFLWGAVLTTFEIPQIYPEKFGFNSEQVGLQFLGILLGTIFGEQFGGFVSEKWMAAGERRRGARPANEYRLWLSHIGFTLNIVGSIIFLVTLANAKQYTVAPAVAAGFSAAGNQMTITLMMTYAIDCYPADAASIGVFIILALQVWGFIGPFWIPSMIAQLGLALTALPVTLMTIGVSALPIVAVQIWGRHWQN